MSIVAPFHSINESSKPAPRYHNNSLCPQALAIPQDDRRADSGGYYVCEQCAKLTQERKIELQALAAAAPAESLPETATLPLEETPTAPVAE